MDVPGDYEEAVSEDEPEEPWDDSVMRDRLFDKAVRVTRATIGRGEGKQPFLFTTTSRAAHVAMTDMGSQAAMYVALVPFGIAVLLMLARFGS